MQKINFRQVKNNYWKMKRPFYNYNSSPYKRQGGRCCWLHFRLFSIVIGMF